MSVISANNKIISLDTKIINHDWNIGCGLMFDGVNDSVDCGNVLNFEYSDEFSFEVVLKIFSNNAVEGIFNKPINQLVPLFTTGIYMKCFDVGNAGFYVTKDKSNVMVKFFVCPKNIINHFIFTKKTGAGTDKISVYANGSKLAGGNVYDGSMSSILGSSSFFINTSQTEYASNCIIYDLKVFNKELTQAEITELYIKQGQIVPATAVANCVADWRFNEKSGTILKDKSPNGYHGTLVNYAAGTTDLGATNSWVDKYGNPITQY